MYVCTLYIDGPEFVEGPSLAAVIEANSVVLVCATEVDGNPFPSVEWTDPNGNLVSQTDPRFMLSDSVSSVASLTILNATVNDSGEWLCRVFTLQFSGASRNITLRVIGKNKNVLQSLVVREHPGSLVINSSLKPDTLSSFFSCSSSV